MRDSRERTAASATVGFAARFAIAVLALAGCGHDWSAADDDGSGGETDAEGIGEVDVRADADGDADRSEVIDGTDGDDDAPADEGFVPVCGDGRVDPPEECELGTSEACLAGACEGSRSCTDTCTWGACGFGAPPTGDTCTGLDAPGEISNALGTRTYNGSTCAATDDGATTACGPADGPDVVMRLELGADRNVTLDTVGSEFDALLRVIAGTDCGGSELTCDDDAAGGTPAQASLALGLSAGLYWVVIDGHDPAARGSYTLNVTIEDLGASPPNDRCDGAIRLDLSDTPSTRLGSTSRAGNHPSSCPLGAGPDVWYRFTLAARTLVYLDLLDGETWDAVLDLRSSTAGCLFTTSLACEDNACGTQRPRWVGVLDAGEYFVLVDGRASGASGDFRLRYQGIDAPCAVGATPITADGTYVGDTTDSADDGMPGCGFGFLAPDFFYYLPLCAGRMLTATTCDAATDFDTVLALYRRGCSAEVACNDDTARPCVAGADTSQITYSATEPAVYLLDVTGGLGSIPIDDRGAFGLTIIGM
jgi:hypothetical protein